MELVELGIVVGLAIGVVELVEKVFWRRECCEEV
jgi:hypothetical protein